jgi:putative endonuclease
MVYHVYIIYSALRDRYYVGYKADELVARIKKHNANHKGFTGGCGDWVLVYKELFSTKQEAMAREKDIKKRKSRAFILKLVQSIPT